MGVISFTAYLKDCTALEAAKLLQKWLDERQHAVATVVSNLPARVQKESEDDPTIVVPVPSDAPPVPQRFGKLGMPSMTHTYRNGQGDVLCHVLRFNMGNGKKEIRPLTLWKDNQGRLIWKNGGLPKPRPLYGLDLLNQRPTASVLIAEGEKAADAARILFPQHVCVTTMNGAMAADKADLAPLKERVVVIWPDNDEAGRNYVEDLAFALIDIKAEISVMKPLMYLPELDEDGKLKPRVTDLSNGYDAADALAEGWTAELIGMLPSEMYQLAVSFKAGSHVGKHPNKKKDKLSELDHILNIVDTFDGLLIYVNGEPYAYKDGHWPMLDETVGVAQRIAHYLGDEVTATKVSALLSLLKTFQAKTEQEVCADLHLICLQNGTLDTRTGELIEHNPDHHLKSQIGCEWNPDAQCTRWLQFLDEIFANDPDKAQKIQLLREWFGYCMTPDNSQHKFLWCVGAGGNGKSVLLDILTHLVGRKNVSDAHIERLGDKFVRAELEGKLVNISAEMSAEATISDGYLKSIVAGDVIEAERKFKPSFSFRPYVRLIGSTNHLPRLLDLSEGFFRRAIILTFNRKFDDAERDPNLKAKLEAELPGILAWAVQGLKDLRARGRFEVPSSSVDALNQYKMDSDPERMYFDECLLLDPTGPGMSPNDIYAGYVEWSRGSGYRPKAKVNFGKRLPDFGVESIRGHSGKRWLVKMNPEGWAVWKETSMWWNPNQPAPIPLLFHTSDEHKDVMNTPSGYKL